MMDALRQVVGGTVSIPALVWVVVTFFAGTGVNYWWRALLELWRRR